MIYLASKSPRRRLLLEQIGIAHTIVDAPIDEAQHPGEPPRAYVERMALEKVQAGLAALVDARTRPGLGPALGLGPDPGLGPTLGPEGCPVVPMGLGPGHDPGLGPTPGLVSGPGLGPAPEPALGPVLGPVLAADTVVVLDNRVLGKPRDADDAMAMLGALSGRMHRVMSAVSVAGSAERGPTAAPDGRRRPGSGAGGTDAPRIMTSISRVWFREISHHERRAYCASGEPMDKAGAYAIQGRAALFIERLDGSYSGVMGLPLFETAALLREAGVGV